MERKKHLFVCFLLCCVLLLSGQSAGRDLEGNVLLGYARGFSLSGQLTFFRLGSWSLPLAFRLGLTFDAFDPGNAADARKIFINDNSGGTVEKDGHVTRISLDVLIPLRWRLFANSNLFAGLRHGRFRGHFKYSGNNEDFDVISRHWALGGGLEAVFPLNERWVFRLTGGGDYYFPARLYGHDTWYNPDNQDDNPRKSYTYADADAAINQPQLVFYIQAGLGLGWGA